MELRFILEVSPAYNGALRQTRPMSISPPTLCTPCYANQVQMVSSQTDQRPNSNVLENPAIVNRVMTSRCKLATLAAVVVIVIGAKRIGY